MSTSPKAEPQANDPGFYADCGPEARAILDKAMNTPQANFSPSLTGTAHLNFMGGETVEQIYSRVSRHRMSMEDGAGVGDEAQREMHAYLCDVEQACETVMGFLNGEHREFHESAAIAKAEGRA